MIHALKDDCDFFYCLVTKKHWNTRQRPLPDGLQFVMVYEPGIYDFAVLHIDQQTCEVHSEKRRIYTEFNNLITDIPKIVINHGCPIFPEYFIWFATNPTDQEMEKACIEEVRSLIGDNTMVVNSHTAASETEWGFGIPIVHGMNPADWKDLPKEPRAFTALSPAGFDLYYNRDCMMRVSAKLTEKYGHKLNYAGINLNTTISRDAYRDYLGKSLLYVDTSFRTPMNRARTEAFLSGCCVIQVEGAHDLDRWAKNGENIILVPNDPEKIADVIADFLENRYEEAIRIGRNAKEMAMHEFSPGRYRKDWLNVFENISHR